MRKIPLKVWYGITVYGYKRIVQEVEASSDELRKWVAIYALYKFKVISYTWEIFNPPPDQNYKFSLVEFEIEGRALSRDDVDRGDCINVKTHYFNTEEEMYMLLEELNIDPQKFGPPWHNDYPLTI